jgi:CRISPR-associated endoribonuclease Cas6
MDASYDNAYHDKLRGRIWRGLEGTEYDDLHDEQRPLGFCFSCPIPPFDMEEGDERVVLISATDRDLLGEIAADLEANPEFNIGEMPFEVTDMSLLGPDVGEPGTTGIIRTGTGLLVRIPPWQADEYDIETGGDHAQFWRPEHSMEPLRVQLENNLDKKHGHYCPDDLPGPSDVEGSLFNEYDLQKTYALPVKVSEQTELTYVVSKWEFGYTVRDDHHRRHLNLALDTGLGERNSLGFGFLNIDEDSVSPPGRIDTNGRQTS